jgi:hypothetical protein
MAVAKPKQATSWQSFCSFPASAQHRSRFRLAYDKSAYSIIHNIDMVNVMSGWHYYRNGQQVGPITLNELKGAIERGEVDGDTLVWQAGMAKWIRVRKLPDLFSSILTPPPLPGSMKSATTSLKSLLGSMFDAVRGERSK